MEKKSSWRHFQTHGGVFPNKNVIWSSQHGFRNGKSSLNDLIAFYNAVAGLGDVGKAADVVYFSFSKAFDSVSHNILTDKLKYR